RLGSQKIRFGRMALVSVAIALALCASVTSVVRAADKVEEQFRDQIEPILGEYCAGCHGNGMKKGAVSFEEVAENPTRLRDAKLWWSVLKNVRAGIMPPAGKPRPDSKELRLLEDWIKYGAFGIEPTHPDPGRVTVRRLNRVEYRNTILEL